MAAIFFSFVPQAAVAIDAETLIVKIKSADVLYKLENYGQAELLFNNIYRLKVISYESSVISLRGEPWIEFAQQDRLVQTQLNATDPLFVLDTNETAKQWYLPKIKIHQAWEHTTGADSVVVAVIDTGIDGRHEDLNDGRVIAGYVNYCQTLNAAQNDCLLRVSGEIAAGVNSDDNGHGTIVSGLIGAIPNNSRGISGISWKVKLMPVKALDSHGSGLSSDVAVAIKWAADHGAKIINMSIGGPGLSGVEVLQEAITYAFNKGVLIVAAAGNDSAVTGGNLNTLPVLPVCADGGANMIIGVAATDIYDRKAKFSNYGSNCIDISAPGTATFVDKQQKQGMISTYFDPTRPTETDLYVYALGTSVAAPLVSGVAALTMAAFPDLDVRAIRDRVIGSVDNVDQYNISAGCGDTGSCVGQIGAGRLNAAKAVTTNPLFTAGTVLKAPGGAIYLVEKGLKRPVSEFVFQQRFAGSMLVQSDQAQIDSLTTGLPLSPVDGTIVKDIGNPTVYLIEGGERLALSYLAFVSRGLKFENVITLPAAEVGSYPAGADAPLAGGLLLKAPDHPAVFIMNNSVRQLLSYTVYKQRGLDKQPIAISSLEELAKYPTHPQGYLYPPADGVMLKGDAAATVYLFQNGARKGLTYQAFVNRVLKFNDIIVVPQSEIEQYQLGADLIE